MKKIFVTGATGFIGKRLVFQLLEKGYEVYALSRIRGVKLGIMDHPRLHMIYGSLDDDSLFLDHLPKEIDAAYYLVHSMSETVNDLIEKETTAAKHFVELMDQTSCQQIIYLGGIFEEETELSLHLRSRKKVEEVLKNAKAALTVFRASIIIGAGSASFEIIRDLVEKLPIMVAPRWVRSLCQPISIIDVLYYLSNVLFIQEMYGKVYEIGGPEVMSFKEVLLRYARFRRLKRLILDVPVLTPKLSSYWLLLITSVRFSLCSYLVESMKHNSYCHKSDIEKILPHPCLTFEEALHRAFLKISQNEVISTWMDAWMIDEKNPDIRKFIEIPKEGCLKDSKQMPLHLDKEEVISRIWSIGGKRGWYGLDWAWQLRGLIDKFFGGAGMNRGRRHPTEINVGDSIDFWRVVKADKEAGHLILYAEMKLPGEAWIEFYVKDNDLHQNAVFRPRGILGRAYWYAMMPFHFLIFKKMAKTIAQKKCV